MKVLGLCTRVMIPSPSPRVQSCPSAVGTVYIEGVSYINIQCNEFPENTKFLSKFNFVSINIKA